MVEEFVADTVVVGGGSGIRLEMHYLVAVLAVVCRPQGQPGPFGLPVFAKLTQ